MKSSSKSASPATMARIAGSATTSTRVLLALAILFVTFALACRTEAQTTSTGALTGTVTDPRGGAVAGANVSVTSETTGETRATASQENGSYLVPLLLPGSYRVEVSKTGFKVTVTRKIRIDVTETARLDLKLELGTVQESVTITTQASQLETTSSTLGKVTSGEVVSSLPLVTRNFTQVIALSPGVSAEVTDAADLGHGGGGSSGNGAPIAQGGTQNDNNFHIDGVEGNDLQSSGSLSGGVGIPNPDTIEEFKVQTGLYDASYGGHAGANVNLVTKGGTNHYHGTVFEYLRNEALNANDFFQNANKVPRGVLKQNQFGFAAGGPLPGLKDKLLLFGSYQGTRQRNGVCNAGCKSNFLEPALTNDRSPGGLGAVLTGQETFFQQQLVAAGVPKAVADNPAVGGPQVHANGDNISPQALALFQMKLPDGSFLIPTPSTVNPTAPADVAGSHPFTLVAPFTENQFVTNADFLHTDKSKFTGRFFFANTGGTTPISIGPQGFSSAVPGFPKVNTTNFRNLSITHTYVFNTNLVNQATVGYHRLFSLFDPKSAFTFSSIGATAPGFDDLFPLLLIASGNSVIGGDGQRFQIAQNSYDAEDSLFYTRGKHSFHFGGGVTRAQDNLSKFHFEGIAVFGTFADFALGQSAAMNGTPFSNVIQSQDFFGDSDRAWRVWDGNLFVQDDIKLTSRLTVNIGFRYDRIGDLGDVTGRNAGFDFKKADPNPPAAGSLAGFTLPSNANFSGTIPAGVTKLGNNLGINGDSQNTMNPRVGFAWQLPHTNRFVLRGGYGIFHSQLTGQPFLQLITAQPFGTIRSVTNIGNSASFAAPFQPPPAIPAYTPYTAAPNQFTGQSITTFDPGYRPSRLTRYGLNLQTELTENLVLEVGYVGARGEHLVRNRSFNQAGFANATNPIRGETTNTFANVIQRAPLTGFSTNNAVQIESAGASWYNALQASLNKRFGHGLQFLASYTFARSLATDSATSTGPNGGTSLGDQNDPRARYGPDQFTRPHRFIVSYVYQLPGPKNRTSFLGEVLGGWQAAGVTTYQAGQNLTLTDTNTFNVLGTTNDRASLAAGCTVSQIGKSGSVQSKLSNYFNNACITTPSLFPGGGGATGFGNLGVGTVRGPDQANYDISIAKRFPLRWEGMNLEFRSEFFNAFNHPQFANPTIDASSGTEGVISSTSVSPRVIQFALKFSF
jgi:hypothetical protein